MKQQHSYLRIRQLRRQGNTYAQISARLGCSNATIRRALVDDIEAHREQERERQRKYRCCVTTEI